MSNLYSKHAFNYLEAGYSPIPAKYGMKTPAIKEWTKYCFEKPEEKDVLTWSNTFHESNIDLALGEASGVIVLDFDCTDPEIIKAIEHILPESPVERIGAKGWARFFRYTGEHSYALKHNGEVVVEILSTNKKITIPPSRHPSGMDYTWTKTPLLDVKKEDLPILPIALISTLQNKLKALFPGTASASPLKTINGRNDALSSACAKLIQEATPLDAAIKQLVEFDKETNEYPLFEDVNEFRHSEPFTNALTFYSNHLQSINTRRFRDHKEYELPITASAVNEVYLEEILKKKEQKQGAQKKLKSPELNVRPPGALGMLYDHILQNSYIPQPHFALSASLAIMGALCGRKTQFQGVASNLYLLNIATSGAGKDAPMQEVKNVLSEINAYHLLGAGDYVSDASLMDELATNPVRVDVIDEASGLLKNVNAGGSGYNGKMADIFCELYSCSTNRFLGRMTAEGRKGLCDRPCVILLASTTPTGFKSSVSKSALEKGLLGRFLIFEGDSKRPARRIEKSNGLGAELREHLLFWKNWEAPTNSEFKIGNAQQRVYDVPATQEAQVLLDAFFKKIDSDRISQAEDSSFLPIIARLYQQMLKIALISACSRIKTGKPVVDAEDVVFATQVMSFYRNNMEEIVENNIFSNDIEAKYVKLLRVIQKSGDFISQHHLNDKTRWLTPKERESILRELVNSRKIIVFQHTEGEDTYVAYASIEEK